MHSLRSLAASTALAAPWLFITFLLRVYGLCFYGLVFAPWSIGAIVAWALMASCVHEPHERRARKKAAIIGSIVFVVTICLHLATMFGGVIYAAKDKDGEFADFCEGASCTRFGHG